MFRTIRCLAMVMLLVVVAVPAAQAQKVPSASSAAGPALEPPGPWTGLLSWMSSLFTGGGPFIDPNGGDRSRPADADGSRFVQGDGGPFIDPNG